MSPAGAAAAHTVGAVAIGRNEGDRLKACLGALLAAPEIGRVVYVDSGSTDGSADWAAGRGAEVVALDLDRPFTAARARNAGIERLRTGGAAPDLVQLVDGDCVLAPGWMAAALAAMAARPRAAVVCGRRRERFPEASVYNRMCDLEWDTPVGEARACGGDALMRMDALAEAGGFDASLIAGEEPDLCLRLRRAGWEVHRIDAEMTLHDAAMNRLGQFWARARRAGHAYAEGAARHGAGPERHWVAETRRALAWGAALPAAVLAGAAAFGPWALAGLAAYPAQVARLALRDPAPGPGGRRFAWTRAGLLTLSKFAEAQGAAGYHLSRWRGRRAGLIEYK